MLTEGTQSMMGASLILWRTTILLTLQIQGTALFSMKTIALFEGQSLEFRCNYQDGSQMNAKYFCSFNDKMPFKHLIRAKEHVKWVQEGRFSLSDNTSGAFFIVRVDVVFTQDSGFYWCGVEDCFLSNHGDVIQLDVSKVNEVPVTPRNIIMDKRNLMLFAAAVVCTAALLCVCLYTLVLLLTLKQQRTRPRQNRKISCDYETMMPAVMSEAEGHSRGSSLEYNTHPDAPTDTTGRHRDSAGSLKRRLSYVEAEAMSITGVSGQNITITCSLNKAPDNVKYFCKGRCRYEDVLISSGTGKWNTKKYRIRDEGSRFYVTIFHLKKEDAGIYACGVEKFWTDPLEKVILTVREGIKPNTKSINPSEPVHPNTSSSMKPLYIGASLGVIVLALALILLIYFRHQKGHILTSSAPCQDSSNVIMNPPECLHYSTISHSSHTDNSRVSPHPTDVTYSSISLIAPDESAVYCNV
ncbi:CMRF35-like molecule 8 [Dunckerocampus dactyliophorus]|uniref:CMRF35-like molecule 8 n=1 Tax=Dunckerocampus dactyliophorus TaxID=161453 RepID=UPI002407090E|nr:CMRF35-like molecule 8 [Dunckerocampus dactyliophorus]